jgi:hypothetical protein
VFKSRISDDIKRNQTRAVQKVAFIDDRAAPVKVGYSSDLIRSMDKPFYISENEKPIVKDCNLFPFTVYERDRSFDSPVQALGSFMPPVLPTKFLTDEK